MVVTTVFDWLFVNQLFGTNDRGEMIYYPNGVGATGYRVPPDREAGVKSGVRRLVLITLLGTLALIVLVPRGVEAWLGYEIPLPWFIGGAVVAVVVIFIAIIKGLARQAAGLEPVQK